MTRVFNESNALQFRVRYARGEIAALRSKRGLKRNDYGFFAAQDEALQIMDQLIRELEEISSWGKASVTRGESPEELQAVDECRTSSKMAAKT